MASPRTKPGTRKLSEVARKLVVPSGIVSTGWPAVRDTCSQKLGISFDDWQDGAGRVILAKRADGRLACMIGGVGMSVPRQVGKTYLFAGMIFALSVNQPKMLTIWSAHHGKTHGETFLAMQDFAKRLKVKPYIDVVYTGSGDEEIRFRNGSRILFGAREHGFGRGIPGVDMIVSDEAQIMSEKALDAQLATMNTSQFGLAVYIGTPPRPEDRSEAFTRMRTEAWEGTLEDSVWVEIGADADADPNDRKQWAKANPSYPHRTPVESMLRLKKKLLPESFMREGLGIWDEEGGTVLGGHWDRCASDKPLPKRGMVLGLAVSFDLSHASVGVAARGGSKVFVGANRRDRGTAWVVDHLLDLTHRHRCIVAVDGGGPAADLIPALTDKGIQLQVFNTKDVLDACSAFFKHVTDDHDLAHHHHPELDAAVDGAVKRDIGDRWAWGRRKSTADVSMLEAVTLAAWEVWRHDQYDVMDSVL